MTSPRTARYVYGITDAICPPACAGVDQQPCELISARAIAAIISPIDVRVLPPTPENLWSHQAVIERGMERHTVLPVRFGTIAADEGALRLALEAHHDQFVAELCRLRGRVELGLRVLWDAAPTPPAASHAGGRGYMLARLERERHADAQERAAQALVATIHEPLAHLAEEAEMRLLATPQMPLAASYLLPRERVDTFRDAVAHCARAHPALRVLCTGPWPPYSFVAAGGLDG